MNVNAADRNRMYDILAIVAENFPGAKLEIVAIGLGADTATMQGDVLNISLKDGSGFAYVRTLAQPYASALDDYDSLSALSVAVMGRKS